MKGPLKVGDQVVFHDPEFGRDHVGWVTAVNTFDPDSAPQYSIAHFDPNIGLRIEHGVEEVAAPRGITRQPQATVELDAREFAQALRPLVEAAVAEAIAAELGEKTDTPNEAPTPIAPIQHTSEARDGGGE